MPESSVSATMLPCITCGYDLRELPADVECPECGTPIARSRAGERLANASPGWLAGVVRGQRLLALGAVVTVTAVFAQVFVPMVVGLAGLLVSRSVANLGEQITQIIAEVVIWIGLLLCTGGTLLLTAPDPRDSLREGRLSARHVARGGLVACIVFAAVRSAALRMPVDIWVEPYATAGDLLGAAAVTVLLVATLLWLAHLAGRIPDGKLVKDARSLARSYRWLLPAIVVAGMVSERSSSLTFLPEMIENIVRIAAILVFLSLFIALLVHLATLAKLLQALRRAFTAAAHGDRAA
jgi:predicted RNA-binding Zn-ribbon protein involved in translation (DUF1610 family)